MTRKYSIVSFYYLFSLILFFVTASCAHTDLKKWDQGFPKSGEELKTNEQKHDEFNKFAIQHLYGENCDYVVLQLNSVETGKLGDHTISNESTKREYYELESYLPVINKVSPKAVENYKKMKHFLSYKNVYGPAAIAGALIGLVGRTNQAFLVIGLGAMLVGGGGVYTSEFLMRDSADDLKDNFNRDLNERLFNSDDKKSSSLSFWFNGLSAGLALAI